MVLRIGVCLLFFILQDRSLVAQFFDNFSDPDIGARYAGSVQDFRVNASQELQLNAPASGSAYLSRSVIFPDSFLWEIYFRLEFDPSASNRLRIWISSDQALLENGDGLYLEIGESLNTDAIRLFRKTGNSRVELAAATTGKVAINPALARVRCSYDENGLFRMWADYTGNHDFGLEFEVTVPQDIFTGTRHTGIHCLFTESRRTAYFFDDFMVDRVKEDQDSPQIIAINPINNKLISIQFNEAIDTARLNEVAVSMLPSVGQIHVQTWQGDVRYCAVSLENALDNGREYHIQVGGIRDLAGNLSADTTILFSYLLYEVPDPYDVLFTELMVKPRPVQGLPGEEYIEIYNRSDKYLQLADFTLLDGTSYKSIDSCALLPGEFAVLVSRNHRALFESFGKVATMASFPSLTDAGKRLVLFYQNSLQVDWVSYTDNWYRSAEKGNGGYSLELINPQAPCDLSRNWIASSSPAGGTPAWINSAWRVGPDTLRPALQFVYMDTLGNGLEMVWDKKLDPFTTNRIASYRVEDLTVSQVHWDPLLPMQAKLNFQETAGVDKPYSILASLVADCEGLIAGEEAMDIFARPVLPNQGELLVNEILFYAETGGSRYVELFNHSPYFIDLSAVFVVDFSTSTAGRAIEHKRLLKPGGIVALGSNTSYLAARYEVPDTAWILQYAVPTLSDREGNVSLYIFQNTERIVIDSVDYKRTMHYPLLSDRRGVSLERLRASKPSNDRNNWYSAAEAVGYGTPGYANSQSRSEEIEPQTERVSLITPYFSPNQDGHLDIMELYFDLNRPGFSARVEVFDLQGARVKILANQELLGSDGYIVWDGTDEDGRIALMGIYVLVGELVHPDGEIIRFKKSCTLVGQLD